MTKKKLIKWSKTFRTPKSRTSLASKYQISPEDLTAFILCLTATYALNLLIISADIYNGVIQGLPEGVGLTISLSDIYFGKYENFFRFEFPYIWLLYSLVITAILRLFNKVNFDHKPTCIMVTIYISALVTSIFYSIITNNYGLFLILSITGLCFCAAQLCTHFLTTLAIVNFLIIITTSLYVATDKKDNKEADKSTYTNILINTNGSFTKYRLIINTKKGLLVQNESNSTLLIPNANIKKYEFIK